MSDNTSNNKSSTTTDNNKYMKLSIVFIILIIVVSFFAKDFVYTDKTNDEYAIQLNVGETYSLNSDMLELTWTSSDETIATVDENGNIYAKDSGVVTITASDGNTIVYEYTIKIINNDVNSISFITKDITLPINDSYQLELNIDPKDYDKSKLTWSSSDESIVTVKNGTITSLKQGTSAITVTSPNGVSDTCNVRVESNVDLENIAFTETSKTLYIGENYQSEINFTPSNIYSEVLYKSSNEKVAKVSNTGLITGISEGETEITATADDIVTKLSVKVIKNKSKTITINFNSNGADKISSTKEKCNSDGSGCKITLPTITRKGYQILGWSKNSDSTSAEFKPGEKIIIYNDATYYAITYKNVNANFKANGSPINDVSKSCSIYNKETSCTIKTPNITRNGYNIIGWGNSSTSTTKLANTNTNIILNANTDFYAITSKTLTATFNSNGANVSENSKKCTVYNNETSCTITAPLITRSGYNIVGWGDNAASTTKTINIGESISLNKDSTYYAVTYKTLTAYFDANRSSISKEQASCNIYNISNSCSVQTPTISRTNYTALGWGTSKDTSNTVSGSGGDLQISSSSTYYALTKINNDGIEVGCTGWMATSNYYYSSASTSSSKTSISVGTAFTIEGLEGSFFKISIPNISGYKYIEHKYAMINLSDYIPSMSFEITNANSSIYKSSGYSLEGVTGTKLYSTGKVYNARLRRNEYIAPILYTVAKKLLVAQRTLESQGYSIKAYDTYRPRSVSTKIYSSLSNLYNNNSNVKENILYSYGLSGKRYEWGKNYFLAPGISKHNTGSAIDMTLINKSTGVEVTMPTAMHELSTKAIKYYSASVAKTPANYSKEMNDFAKIMDSAATSAGLTTLSSEWWHFQDLDAHDLIKGIETNGCDFSVTNVYSY